MLPGLINWPLDSSLLFILSVFVFCLHDYAIVPNLETHSRQKVPIDNNGYEGLKYKAMSQQMVDKWQFSATAYSLNKLVLRVEL